MGGQNEDCTGGENDSSVWLVMGERGWHSCSDKGQRRAMEGDISPVLHLQLTWDPHANLPHVQDNINQEGDQAKKKLHWFFKLLPIMWGQHLLVLF